MMNSPQLEDGYTKIANEILDVMSKVKFNGTQFRILMAVWRYTYGFNRKEHPFSLSFLSEATDINKDQVKRELAALIDRKVLIEVKKADFNSARVLAFNKNYSEWEWDGISTEGAKKTTGDKNNDSLDNTEGANPPTLQGANPPTPQGANPPTKKENIKKNNKKNIIVPYQEIFELYMQQGIIKHKSLTEKMKQKILKASKTYTIEEIKLAIERYGQMYRDNENEYAKNFCKYAWTLEELMTRDKGISEFLDEGGKWIRYVNSNKASPQNQWANIES